MTSFWNLFMLFVAINIPFAFVVGAFDASPAFNQGAIGVDGLPLEDDIDFSQLGGTSFPDGLQVNYTDNPSLNCGVSGTDTLIGELCFQANIQNTNNTAGSSAETILGTSQVGILDWVTGLADFGQILIFGVQLLFSAVTGGFIVSVITSFLFADQFPPEFIIGIQVFIGLMWLSFFFKMTRIGSPNPAE